MKKSFSKLLLGGTSASVIAAMSSSIFLVGSPGMLFGAPLNGNDRFVTRVDLDDNDTRFQVRVIDRGVDGQGRERADIVVINFGRNAAGNLVTKRFYRESGRTVGGNATAQLTPELDAIIEKCFPEVSGSPQTPFTGDDVQALFAFFDAN